MITSLLFNSNDNRVDRRLSCSFCDVGLDIMFCCYMSLYIVFWIPYSYIFCWYDIECMWISCTVEFHKFRYWNWYDRVLIDYCGKCFKYNSDFIFFKFHAQLYQFITNPYFKYFFKQFHVRFILSPNFKTKLKLYKINVHT